MKVTNFELFKNKVNDITLPDSSIGVYNLLDIEDDKDMVLTISEYMSNGIRKLGLSHIINDINFYGTTKDWGYKTIASSSLPCLIIAIPSELHDFRGNHYYLGDFSSLDARKAKYHERDNGSMTKLWLYNYLKHIQVFPKEFILGALIPNNKTHDADLVFNPNYIGKKPEIERFKIFDEMLKKCSQSLKESDMILIYNDDINVQYHEVCNEIIDKKNNGKDVTYLESFKSYIEKNYDVERRKDKH